MNIKKSNKKILTVTLLSSALVLAFPPNPIEASNHISVQTQTGLTLSLSGQSWGTNYGVNATLNNTSGKLIGDWKIVINSDITIDQIWSAKTTTENGKTVILPMDWNRSIAADGNIEFGYIGAGKYDSNLDYSTYYKINGVWTQDSTTDSNLSTNLAGTQNEVDIASGNVKISYDSSSWGTGYTMKVIITNSENNDIEDWKLTIPASLIDINSIWCTEVTKTNDSLIITPLGYNQAISSNGSINFGFTGNGTCPSDLQANLSYKINGKWYTMKDFDQNTVEDGKNKENEVEENTQESKVEESKTETKVEESKVEETKVEESKTEETKVENKEETKVEESKEETTSLSNDKQAQFGKETHGGDATFYGAGPGGCCNLDDYEDLYYTVAMNRPDYNAYNLAGAYLEVTDKDGDKIHVLVTNELPEGQAGDLDLSVSAFDAIEPLETGRMKCTWKIIPFPTTKPIAYKFKPSSSQFWAEVQIREQRYPIKSVEYLDNNGEWVALERKPYNYYCAPRGMGSAGPYTFRITDMYGHVLIDENIPLNTTENVIPGKANFPY